MSDLLIRNISAHLKHQIEERARANRRSLSEEAKTLLEKAVADSTDDLKIGTELFNLIRPEDRGDDLIFEIPGEIRKPPDFE
jgi:plasmid stability protein